MNHLSDNHYRKPSSFRSTMTTKQLRETLLDTNGWLLACGERWDIKSRKLGVGVHEVWLAQGEAP